MRRVRHGKSGSEWADENVKKIIKFSRELRKASAHARGLKGRFLSSSFVVVKYYNDVRFGPCCVVSTEVI